jgi:hypothetical protein
MEPWKATAEDVRKESELLRTDLDEADRCAATLLAKQYGQAEIEDNVSESTFSHSKPKRRPRKA